MSASDDDLDPPSVADPYEVLAVERSATADQIKSAYRKAALRCHPDKVAEHKKDEAHGQFQAVAFAYAVLSDPARRKRYDETGSTSESVVDAEGFDWTDFYRSAFADAVSADAIATFAHKYKQSDEERADLLDAYRRGKGRMDRVYEAVMLSNVLEDDTRFRAIIDAAIADGDVPAFKAYTDETAASKRARENAARKESDEAEEYARELGVHDKLFGPGRFGDSNGGSDDDNEKGEDMGESTSPPPRKKRSKNKPKAAKGKKDDQAGLAALIQKRQQDRAATFLDGLAEKYGANAQKSKSKKGGKKGKKRALDEDDEDDEPSEEAFQAAAARLQSKAGKSKKAKK